MEDIILNKLLSNLCTTTITIHENGNPTITSFYLKNNSVWCKSVTGSIESDCKVYKVNSDEPYIREFGRKWNITNVREKEIIKTLYQLRHKRGE